jgi:hypothetical protein
LDQGKSGNPDKDTYSRVDKHSGSLHGGVLDMLQVNNFSSERIR